MTPAARILTALQLLKADPVGLGGMVLRTWPQRWALALW